MVNAIFLEIIQTPEGDIVLLHSNGPGEETNKKVILRIQFSKNIKEHMGDKLAEVAHSMIQAGIESLNNINDDKEIWNDFDSNILSDEDSDDDADQEQDKEQDKDQDKSPTIH